MTKKYMDYHNQKKKLTNGICRKLSKKINFLYHLNRMDLKRLTNLTAFFY